MCGWMISDGLSAGWGERLARGVVKDLDVGFIGRVFLLDQLFRLDLL